MAVVTPVFLDTSVLIPGLIDTGAGSTAAQEIMDAVADGRLREACTAWHCCLEFYAVVTRLPGELRLSPEDALRLLEDELLGRLRVSQLPEHARSAFLRAVEFDRVSGGRVYDAHIAEIARVTGARAVVTGNPRHFASLVRHQIAVLTAADYAATL